MTKTEIPSLSLYFEQPLLQNKYGTKGYFAASSLKEKKAPQNKEVLAKSNLVHIYIYILQKISLAEPGKKKNTVQYLYIFEQTLQVKQFQHQTGIVSFFNFFFLKKLRLSLKT